MLSSEMSNGSFFILLMSYIFFNYLQKKKKLYNAKYNPYRKNFDCDVTVTHGAYVTPVTKMPLCGITL